MSANDPGVLLPALSTHEPASVVLAVSGPEYVVEPVQEAMPDVASVPANATATGLVYQPPLVGGRAADAVTAGAVASYFSGKVEAALTLPALSRHVPETEALLESGPSYEAVLHDAMPEVASDPLNDSVTGLLNQPFASAPGRRHCR